jgi:2-amino-4-hydroxy-6-hydroxymethyldihydropteridine diphosphokinase
MTHTAYVGLGSNLDDPRRQVEYGLRELDGLAATRVLSRSSLYRSDPIGPVGQPPYINAVAALATGLSPGDLLAELQRLERAHGRVRSVRWGPRTLDLDILLFDDLVMVTPDLEIPHRELARRAFVLVPLAELAPNLELPGLGPLRTLLHGCESAGLERLP